MRQNCSLWLLQPVKRKLQSLKEEHIHFLVLYIFLLYLKYNFSILPSFNWTPMFWWFEPLFCFLCGYYQTIHLSEMLFVKVGKKSVYGNIHSTVGSQKATWLKKLYMYNTFFDLSKNCWIFCPWLIFQTKSLIIDCNKTKVIRANLRDFHFNDIF